MGRLRVGILGGARIARQLVAGVRGSQSVEVVALASRELGRAEALARELGVPRAIGSYEALLADPGIDAVYVALPNSLHAAWSIAAARAGKHVLCEKPLAASLAEGLAMFEAAAAAGVVLLEAYPFHFQPQMQTIERLVSAGELGEIQTIQAAFGYLLTNPANVRWSAALAGGALMDAGCYPVSLCRRVLGARPDVVHARARFTEGGVDRSLVGTLVHASGALAQIACGFDAILHRTALVAGSRGVLETDYLNVTDAAPHPLLRLRRVGDLSVAWEDLPVARSNGFRLEAEAFAAMVQGGDPQAVAAHRAASLDTLATLAALRESARTGEAVSVVDPEAAPEAAPESAR